METAIQFKFDTFFQRESIINDPVNQNIIELPRKIFKYVCKLFININIYFFLLYLKK